MMKSVSEGMGMVRKAGEKDLEILAGSAVQMWDNNSVK